LSDLKIDGVTVEDFNSSTTEYNVVLPYGTTEVPVVTATAKDTNATVTITQAASLPGTATIKVTAEDGVTTKTYTVSFTIAPNTDASLSNIKVNGIAISGFDPSNTEYNIILPSGTTEIPVVTATATDSNATVTITQAAGLPGEATIEVTAEDGITTKTYKVYFTVASNNDASLSEIKVNGIAVTGFDPSTTEYNVVLPYGTTEVPVVTATATDTNATVTITQAAGLPGTAIIKVTAEDGVTTRTYTVSFTVAPNTDASLSDLKIDGVTVTGFDPTVTEYNIILPSGTTEVPVVTATANATVTITQAAGLPGTATIKVTAEDGVTTRTYTVNFTVAPNNDASLRDLKIDGVTVEGFNPTTTDYNIVLPSGTTEIPVVTAVATDANATVTITQAAGLPGEATIQVVAADGVTTKTYKVSFTVAANNDASLSDLKIDGVTVTGFDPSITEYNIVLPYGTAEIPVVTATSIDSNATVTITQAAGLPGTATVEVTAEDRITIRTYIVNFTVAVLESIAITNPANKLTYYVGEMLDINGLIVTGTFSDGTTAEMPITVDNISGFDSSKPAASQTLTITIDGKTATYSIVIKQTPGSGGGVIIMPPVPDEDKPDSGEEESDLKGVVSNGDVSISIELEINSDTNTAEAIIDEAILDDILENTETDEAGLKTVTIDIPAVEDTEAYKITIPASAINSSELSNVTIIKTEIATITLPSNMLPPETAIEDEKASLIVAPGDKSSLSAELQAEIGDKPLIKLELQINGKQVAWENKMAPVTVSIPYKPTEAELADPEHITVWYIDGAGNVIPVSNGRYDPETGMVTFSITHFSQYAVVYVKKTFKDIEHVSWAKKQIEVLASKGIIKGINDKEFAPDANITRGDFILLLVRTLGLNVEFEDNFDDVNVGDYYYEAIGIARKLGIAKGQGNNLFNPKDTISRQDMMVLTERALVILNKINKTSVIKEIDRFIDKEQIAEYARESIEALVKEGLIKGDGSRINPLAKTTRAEAAVFLYRIYNKCWMEN
ncbi:MAG TPA: hypothetical protein GXX36_10270, partial [Clostridiaceae bacterium]|nr:hypothetical protein [Clostridiaceae bacterium]